MPSLSSPVVSQVEEVKLQLQAAHTEEQRTLAAELEAKRSSEVMGLKAQYEAELLGVKEELARVQRTGEEEKTCVEQQLATEVAKKQVRTQCTKLHALPAINTLISPALVVVVHISTYVILAATFYMMHMHGVGAPLRAGDTEEKSYLHTAEWPCGRPGIDLYPCMYNWTLVHLTCTRTY